MNMLKLMVSFMILACMYLEANSYSSHIFIDEGGCESLNSCKHISAATLSIGRNACGGQNSCSYFSVTKSKNVNIGENSCSAYRACKHLYGNVLIGNSSCSGSAGKFYSNKFLTM